MKIVAGGNHTLVLYPCGTVLASGSNNHGQCGITPRTDAEKFTRFQTVPGPPELKDDDQGKITWANISAGWDFSVFVSSKGRVYTCGLGTKGELGSGALSTVSTSLREIEIFRPTSRVTSVCSGMAHTLVVLENGEVYGWGAGRKGQLGAPLQAVVPSPRRIELDFHAAAAVCGREFGFIISKDGSHHCVLGGDKYSISASQPAQGEFEGWKSVQASWGGVYVLLDNGTVRAWGRNDKGQLPPAGLSNVEQVAIGSEHGVATIKDAGRDRAKAIAWGWGEHGNCGKRKDDRGGNVIGEIFEVPCAGGERLSGVGAGCATSWFLAE